jgi:hypothetical protein
LGFHPVAVVGKFVKKTGKRQLYTKGEIINIAFIGKLISPYVVSTNVADLGTTYDVTLGNDSIRLLHRIIVFVHSA